MPSTPAALSVLDEDTVICTPRKGAWAGGDEILMVIPKLDRRKGKKTKRGISSRFTENILVFNIYFDYGSMGKFNDIQVSSVDSRTIFFQTPSCPLIAAGQNLVVPIVVTQNDLIIAQIDYIYLARK